MRGNTGPCAALVPCFAAFFSRSSSGSILRASASSSITHSTAYAPIGAYAVECVMDELAEALKMDPLELRLKNAAKQGTKAAHGPVFPRIGYVETLEAAKAHPHYTCLLYTSPSPRDRTRS